jgi:hypothetical protein
MKRKRKHISLTTKLAAALACLLPQDVRDFMRGARISPEAVISKFNFDHIVLHALPFMGSDEWWNLDPKLADIHKEKSAKDTSRIAKVRRLSKRHEEFRKQLLAPTTKFGAARSGPASQGAAGQGLARHGKARKYSRWPKRSLRR